MIQTYVQVSCDGCGALPGIFHRTDEEARRTAQDSGFFDLEIHGVQVDLCGRCTPELIKRAVSPSLTDGAS